jgi:hypothetical protein
LVALQNEPTVLKMQLNVIAELHLAEILPDGAEHVSHCLSVGELEMAFEWFVLSLLEVKAVLPPEEKAALRELGFALGLDKESIFRADFWGRVQGIIS